MSVCLVYINTQDRDEAIGIGRTLVESGLAAAANVIVDVTSIFYWNEKLNEKNEVILLVKTRADLVDEIVARVRSLHCYECPSLVAVPVSGGNPDYLAWIAGKSGDPT